MKKNVIYDDEYTRRPKTFSLLYNVTRSNIKILYSSDKNDEYLDDDDDYKSCF